MIRISAKSTNLSRKPIIVRSAWTLEKSVLLPVVNVKPPKALDPKSPLIRGILGPAGRKHLQEESIETIGKGKNTVWLVPNDNPYSEKFSLLAMALKDHRYGQVPMSPDQNSPKALEGMFLAYLTAVRSFPEMEITMGFNISWLLTGQLVELGTHYNLEKSQDNPKGKVISNQNLGPTHAQIFAKPEEGDNISYKKSTNPHEIALIHGSEEEKQWAESVAVYLEQCLKESASLNGINTGKKLFEVLKALPKFEIITSKKGLKIIFQQNQEELLTNPKFTEFFQSVLALIQGYNEKKAIEENDANNSLAPNFLNIHNLLNDPKNVGDILKELEDKPEQDFIPVRCMAVFVQEGEAGTTEVGVRKKPHQTTGGVLELVSGHLLDRGNGVMTEKERQVWENNRETFKSAFQ